MLRNAGVEVSTIEFTNDVSNRLDEVALLLRSSWSTSSAKRVEAEIETFKPDVLHVHNFWMEASPSVLSTASHMGVSTVLTLHNFRLLCTNAQLLRNGAVCEDCVGKAPWRGVVRRCYRNSLLASAAVGAMITTNRLRGTWHKDVDAFIALTHHSRARFIAGGLPADRIFVKPNFGTIPSAESTSPSAFQTFLFVGRLSPEKGVGILLEAWKLSQLRAPAKLRIVGDGPQREFLQNQAAAFGFSPEQVEFTGFLSRDRVAEQIAQSRCLILPSIWYETFGMTILEAAACGRPAIASALGALPEVVLAGQTGLLFPVGSATALSDAIRAIADNDELADRLGSAARNSYLQNYTEQQNLPALMKIYHYAVERRRCQVIAQ